MQVEEKGVCVYVFVCVCMRVRVCVRWGRGGCKRRTLALSPSSLLFCFLP